MKLLLTHCSKTACRKHEEGAVRAGWWGVLFCLAAGFAGGWYARQAIGARAAGPAAGGTAAAPIMSPARQTAPFSTSTPAAPAPATPDAIANVKRLVPDLNSTSVVQGAETLRRAALKDFKAAAIEMGARLQQAQQALEQAQKSGSQAEQEAAIKKLRDMQAQETAQIQRIAARLQSEMTALKQLKAGGK